MDVAIVGCGSMGSRIARRLHSAGHDVVAWNRDPNKLAPLAAVGVAACSTPAEAASRAEIVITMVSDDIALRSVSEGPEGICEGVVRNACVLQMSTVSPRALQRLVSVVPAEVGVLDVPVLGSIAEAEGGSLKLFVGGTEHWFDRAEPILSILGEPIPVGALGMGTAAKLVANSTLFGCLVVLGESLALARQLGLPSEVAFEILERTPLAAQATRRRHAVDTGVYPRRFPLNLARKDAELVCSELRSSGQEAKLTEAILSWFLSAENAGLGESDYTELMPHIFEGKAGEL